MANALYDQRSGEFSIWADPDDGGVERVLYWTCGYSGKGSCRNDPGCENRANEGPLPIGRYHVEGPIFKAGFAPPVFRLRQYQGERYGRSGFLIHGDNPTHDASRGCIILWKSARDAVLEYGVTDLEVCASPKPVQQART